MPNITSQTCSFRYATQFFHPDGLRSSYRVDDAVGRDDHPSRSSFSFILRVDFAAADIVIWRSITRVPRSDSGFALVRGCVPCRSPRKTFSDGRRFRRLGASRKPENPTISFSSYTFHQPSAFVLRYESMSGLTEMRKAHRVTSRAVFAERIACFSEN